MKRIAHPITHTIVCSVLAITLIVASSALMVGCASVGPVRPVDVAEIKSLAGTWEGIVYLPGFARDDITLTLRENGSYEVFSKTSLGVSSGRGHIGIRNGRVAIEGERGRGAGTVLRTPAGDLIMKVDMTLSDNSNLSAKLWRKH